MFIRKKRLEKKTNELSNLLTDSSVSVIEFFQNSISIFQNSSTDVSKNSLLETNEEFSKNTSEKLKKIEKRCIEILALHRPTGSELRMILMTFRVNIDLSRIFNLSKGIAEISQSILESKKSIGEYQEFMSKIIHLTVKDFQNSITAFTQKDSELAERSFVVDKEINQLRDDIIEKVLTKNKMPEEYKLIRIVQKIERIGDHCKSISSSTIYVVKGILDF